jgi:RND family efflux transporter MFP subunit
MAIAVFRPLPRFVVRWLIALVLALLVLAALGWRFWRPLELPLATVAPGRVVVIVSGPGTVQARVPLALSARVTSTVVTVLADVGDEVRAGQMLVTLDDRDLGARRAAVAGQQLSLARQVEAAEAGVARARADLDLAQARHRREQDLHRQGFLSAAALEVSQAGARSATAGLSSAEATLAARQAEQGVLVQEARVADTQLGLTRLAAPMAAVVVQRLVEPGTTVAPGVPILRLVDPASAWVAMRIDEAQIARVRKGQAATIRLRSGEQLPGHVARIAMQSDTATRELDVHVAFDRPPARLVIDQEAELQLEVGHDEGLVMPLAALTRHRDGRVGVLKVLDGRTQFVAVRSGASAGASVIVREGLAAGDVVVAQAEGVREHQRVAAAAR